MLSFKEFLLEAFDYESKAESMKIKYKEKNVEKYLKKFQDLFPSQPKNILWCLQFLENNSLKDVDTLLTDLSGDYKLFLPKVDFAKKTKEEIKSVLEKLYNENKAKEDKSKGVIPQKNDEEILHCKSGNVWWFVDRGSCKEESRSGDHCGNINGKTIYDQRILSLRTPKKQVIMTFILEPDNQLGEMKAKGNLKPAKENHDDIMELLTHGEFILTKGSKKKKFEIHGISGEGNFPHLNFSIFDFSEADLLKIHQHNTDFNKEPNNKISKNFIKDQIKLTPDEILGTYNSIKNLYKEHLDPYLKDLLDDPSLENWKNALEINPRIIINVPEKFWSKIPNFEEKLINKLAYTDIILKSPVSISKNLEILKKVIKENPFQLEQIQTTYKHYDKLLEIAVKEKIDVLNLSFINNDLINPELAKYIIENFPNYISKIPQKSITPELIKFIITNRPENILFLPSNLIPTGYKVPLDDKGNLKSKPGMISSLLHYFPKEIPGDFWCLANDNLTTLEGCPEKIGKEFLLSSTKLKNLKFGPKFVGGKYNCSDNKLESLEGCISETNDSFNCSFNNLKSLKFGPSIVHGNFDCSFNKLDSFEGWPKEIFGNLDCSNNSKKFNKKEIQKICKVHGNITF